MVSCLRQSEQLDSNITAGNKLLFNEETMIAIVYQTNTGMDLHSQVTYSSLINRQTEYPDSEPASLRSYILKFHAWRKSRKYQFVQGIYRTMGSLMVTLTYYSVHHDLPLEQQELHSLPEHIYPQTICVGFQLLYLLLLCNILQIIVGPFVFLL